MVNLVQRQDDSCEDCMVQRNGSKQRSFSLTSLSSYELLYPKIIILKPPNKVVSVGDEVRILCLLTGYPSEKLTWYLNGEQLMPTSDGRITFKNNFRELVIKNTQPDDGGNILVHVRNKYGEVYGSCSIRIETKRKLKRNISFLRSPIHKKLSRALSFRR